MNFETRQENNAVVVRVLSRRLDVKIASDLKSEMEKALASDVQQIYLDLGAVEFMDSSGLGAIIGSIKQVSQGQEITLCNLQEPIQEVFKLTHLDRLFDISRILDDSGDSVAA